jgi:hypothetical protein
MVSSMRGSYTPLYASPQQMRGEPPDPRDDVFSLGVIWFQLLSGEVTAGRPGGSGWRRRLGERGMPAPLTELLEACIEDNPADSPTDAGTLAEKLDAGVPVVAVAPVMPVASATPPSAPPVAILCPPGENTPPSSPPPATPPAPTKDCPWCGERVLAVAKVCKHCGQTIDAVILQLEKQIAEKSASAPAAPAPMIFMNAGGGGGGSSSSSRSTATASAAVVAARPAYRRVAPRRAFPHLTHFILTLLTCGIWLPVWVLGFFAYLVTGREGSVLAILLTFPALGFTLVVAAFTIAALIGSRVKTNRADSAPATSTARTTAPTPPTAAPKGQEDNDQEAEQKAKAQAKRDAEESRKKAAEEKVERERAEHERVKAEKAEQSAGANLKYAKKLLTLGETEKAKERLREIVREYPGTQAAKEAGDALESIGR